ncbi:hypothetical protein D4764_21G0007910 [Takifugu flavidus]|uniref:Uncharacterized protein n=1 Tax=Takifugu flavidus TaxID=433684 RepID=A0A5C6NGX7_9TELE|nr:hypothetical protein D4764_21G0007910 [Takifugu flavidus]
MEAVDPPEAPMRGGTMTVAPNVYLPSLELRQLIMFWSSSSTLGSNRPGGPPDTNTIICNQPRRSCSSYQQLRERHLICPSPAQTEPPASRSSITLSTSRRWEGVGGIRVKRSRDEGEEQTTSFGAHQELRQGSDFTCTVSESPVATRLTYGGSSEA